MQHKIMHPIKNVTQVERWAFEFKTIHEMHYESECSETKNVHAFIFTALTDMFDFI